MLSGLIEGIEAVPHSQQSPAVEDGSNGSVVHQYAIPLDDLDTAAWEDALSLMYPSVPLFEINWGNAAGLLLLADKYDMPCLTKHVKVFLDAKHKAFARVDSYTAKAASEHADTAGPSRFRAHLSDGRYQELPAVFQWLEVTSKCGLDEHATICIEHIVDRQWRVPPGVLGNLRAEHAEQLLWGLQEALQFAALPWRDFVCTQCYEQWYQQPRGLFGSAFACWNCGCQDYEPREDTPQPSD